MGMKKLAALVMALVLCLCAVSAMAAVARVDGVEYNYLQDTTKKGVVTKGAISAALETKKPIEIIGDLNGFTFSTDNTTSKTRDLRGLVIEGAGGKIIGQITAVGLPKEGKPNKQVSMAGVTFRNLTFEGQGRIGFSADRSTSYEGMVIENCTFTDTASIGKAAITINKNAQSVDGLSIVGNVFDGYTSTIILNGAAGAEDTVTIRDNIIKNPGYNAIQALNIGMLIIDGNTISGGDGDAIINVKGTEDVVVANNNVSMVKEDQLVVDNVTGITNYEKDNKLQFNGQNVELEAKNVASGNDDAGEVWNASNFVAINSTRDDEGKYTAGIFVGGLSPEDVPQNAAVASVGDGQSMPLYAVGSASIKELVEQELQDNPEKKQIVACNGKVDLVNIPVGVQVSAIPGAEMKVNGVKVDPMYDEDGNYNPGSVVMIPEMVDANNKDYKNDLVYAGTGDVVLKSTDSFANFKQAELYYNGKKIGTVTKENPKNPVMQASEGSIKVAVNGDEIAEMYGDYKLVIKSKWGEVSGTFTNKAPNVVVNLPQTGDDSNLLLWASMMVITMVGFVLVSKKTRLN